MENAAVPLAALHGVDALVAGHTHELFPGPCPARPDWIDPNIGTIHGTPVVQPGHEGSHLGVIDLTLSEVGKDRWRVSANQSHLVPVIASEPCSGGEGRAIPAPPVLSNSDVMNVTAQDHIATLGYIRQRVGETLVPLESYFALVGNSASVQVVADAQRDYAERMMRGHELGHLPLLSAAAPFKAGGRGGPQNYTDVPAGPLAIKNASDLYIYPNTVVILRANGAQLTDWLERAACAFHQLVPGRDEQLLIDGLTYAIDVTAPPCYSADGEDRFPSPGRIRDLRHNGQPVQPDQEFLVVTNSYRAAGGGHFASPAAAEPVLKTAHARPRYPDRIFQALREASRDHQPDMAVRARRRHSRHRRNRPGRPQLSGSRRRTRAGLSGPVRERICPVRDHPLTSASPAQYRCNIHRNACFLGKCRVSISGQSVHQLTLGASCLR
ncbi:5'-nucleotidase C-terminal domain-containing protein [Rhodophyticola porphyridii]|uniref:5'-nucleotidase C-terminal domain-containing protein n=1 Tax=Rhodophyticola porphyridii TaxID=1852017 RepID=UPI0035CE9896